MRLLKIGRDQSCDIVLQSAQVSSLHAEITILNNGDILLEDKGSRNGTMVGNQAIQPGKSVNIRRGDMVTFAGVPLNWSAVPMPEDNSAYKGIFGIGSNFQNEIQISGNTVSRFHATVKVGKDNKVYIVDHSKNGTTVNGVKVPANSPYRIKKNSSVVCGGVPVDLSRVIPWPAEVWKWVAGIAATVAIIAGLGFGLYKIISSSDTEKTDAELYARYNNSVVMLMGVYHYEITVGNYDLDKINSNIVGQLGTKFYIPKKVLWNNGKVVDVSKYSQKELIDATDKCGFYNATGFFVSNDGQIITNLHVVKPWLFDNVQQQIQDHYTQLLAQATEILNSAYVTTSLSAIIPQLKVEGKLDYIALLPQGETYDPENIQKCKVLSAGNDKDVDIALLQTISKRLPTADCTYVNVVDSMETSEEAYTVGNHVYTIGFPTGMNYEDLMQKAASESGIQVVAQPGNIIQKDSEYDFGYNAASTGGASGSPVFNEYGKLIGVHHQGASAAVTQGYNFGVKAKYVQELLAKPHNMGITK